MLNELPPDVDRTRASDAFPAVLLAPPSSSAPVLLCAAATPRLAGGGAEGGGGSDGSGGGGGGGSSEKCGSQAMAMELDIAVEPEPITVQAIALQTVSATLAHTHDVLHASGTGGHSTASGGGGPGARRLPVGMMRSLAFLATGCALLGIAELVVGAAACE